MITSVLTGDIMNSQQVDPSNWLASLKQVLSTYGTEPRSWQFYRGDSFQLEVPQPQEALTAALLIKADVKVHKELDVRLAIGIGSKSRKAAKITEANGEAFVNSGRLFEDLKKQSLAIRSPWLDFDEQMNLYLELGLLVMDHWTPNSAEMIKLALQNPDATQQELSQKLGISQSNISARMKRATFESIIKIDQRYRHLLTDKLSQG